MIKVTHGSFDTHAGQLATHHRLLEELAQGLVAFRAAMEQLGLWQDILVMTYSEFAAESPRMPAMEPTMARRRRTCFWGRVKGGLYGAASSPTDLQDNDLKHTVDFRSLYATVGESGGGVWRVDRFWALPGARRVGLSRGADFTQDSSLSWRTRQGGRPMLKHRLRDIQNGVGRRIGVVGPDMDGVTLPVQAEMLGVSNEASGSQSSAHRNTALQQTPAPVEPSLPLLVAEGPNSCEIVSCGSMGIKQTCQITCPADKTPKVQLRLRAELRSDVYGL